MVDPGDEPPFPPMAPEGIEELSEALQDRQSALKQEAADALEDGDADRALEKLTAAIELGCASALMYSRRGQILLQLGRPFAAVNDCTAAVLIDSELASAYKTRARALSRLAEWAGADADYREALRLNFDDAAQRESLAVAARLSGGAGGEAPGASEPPLPPGPPPGIAELSEEAQDEQVGLRQECQDALEDGDVGAALEKITAAIVLGCATAQMYCARADILLQLERPRAAVNDCTVAISINSESGKAFRIRGRACAVLEQWADAHSNFQESLRLDYDEATNEECLKVAARMRASTGSGEAPASEMRVVACAGPQIDPGDEPPFPALSPPDIKHISDETQDRQAELKQECADALEAENENLALEKVTEAIGLGCANALMYCRRAQILLQLDRPRAAVNDCRAALAINSQSVKALKLRARAYSKTGYLAEAKTDYESALKLEQDDVVKEEYQALIKRMEQEKREALRAARQRWEIVGGADRGGIVVREGPGKSSPQVLDPLDMATPHRLSTGATVSELELVGDRLHFERLTGSGPREGWISIALQDKVLAIPMAEGQQAGGLEVVSAEEPPFPAMTPPGKLELSEAEEQQQAALKQQAAEALEEGNRELALEKLTGAISLGCASALMYCRRGDVLLQLGRPRAAANDCTAALAINPDSGKAFKIRARAHVKLMHWTDAHSDFQEGLRIDYDEATYEESVAVEAKMRGIRSVATEKRLQKEEDRIRKKEAEEKAEEEMRRQAELEIAQQRAKEAQQMRKFEHMYLNDKFGALAWKQGYMTDFMGVKRGKCKCKKCPVYCWTPVKLSS